MTNYVHTSSLYGVRIENYNDRTYKFENTSTYNILYERILRISLIHVTNYVHTS